MSVSIPHVDAADVLRLARRNRGAGESLVDTLKRLVVLGALDEAEWVQADAAESLHVSPRMLTFLLHGEAGSGGVMPPSYFRQGSAAAARAERGPTPRRVNGN